MIDYENGDFKILQIIPYTGSSRAYYSAIEVAESFQTSNTRYLSSEFTESYKIEGIALVEDSKGNRELTYIIGNSDGEIFCINEIEGFEGLRV